MEPLSEGEALTDQGPDDQGPDDEEEDDTSDSEEDENPKKRRARKKRDPNAPFPANHLRHHCERLMARFIRDMDRLNQRVIGPQCRVSAYCAAVCDSEEKGSARLLRLGRPLNAASAHIDTAWADSDDDALLHKLFQARLVSMHMGGSGALDRLARKFGLIAEAEAVHADVSHAPVHADAVPTAHADGIMTLVVPERMSPMGKSWEQCANDAKEMMLFLFNVQHGTSHGKSDVVIESWHSIMYVYIFEPMPFHFLLQDARAMYKAVKKDASLVPHLWTSVVGTMAFKYDNWKKTPPGSNTVVFKLMYEHLADAQFSYHMAQVRGLLMKYSVVGIV